MPKIATFTVRIYLDQNIVDRTGEHQILEARYKLMSLAGVKSVVHEKHITDAENAI